MYIQGLYIIDITRGTVGTGTLSLNRLTILGSLLPTIHEQSYYYYYRFMHCLLNSDLQYFIGLYSFILFYFIYKLIR